MNVNWRTEEPEVEKKSKMSKQLVVLTNYGNLNTAVWSGTRATWYLDGLTAGRECVIAWLDGLGFDTE